MPLIFAAPIIAGLVGLFGGSIVTAKADHPAAAIGSTETKQSMPIWVTISLIVAGLIVVLVIIKKVMKSV